MDSPVALKRHLGLIASISIIIGSVIGSSVFMKPSTMANQVTGPIMLIGVWVFAGFISLIGGMINAEIGSAIPESGGQYIYFKKYYGDTFAFIYGWSGFIVINTASVAAISYVMAEYANLFLNLPKMAPSAEKSIDLYLPFVGHFYPLQNIGVKLFAIVIVIFLTWMNAYTRHGGNKLLTASNIAKLACFVFLLISIFLLYDGGKPTTPQLIMEKPVEGFWLLGFIAAMSGAFAAYDGWNNIGFMAGEIKNPSKTLPRALMIGLFICMIIYILINLAFLYVVPFEAMKNSKLIAADVMNIVFGKVGSTLISVFIVITTFGAANSNIVACARVTYAMSLAKEFFPYFGTVHPTYQTPSRALWLHTFVICLYILSGSFDMLTDLFVFVTWIFYGFAAYAIFMHRNHMKNINLDTTERGYRMWGYPVLPILFVLFSLFYTIITIYNDVTNYLNGATQVINSSLAFVVIALGFLVRKVLKTAYL